jgi:transcription elongation factor GreA-like protein
VKNNFRKNEQNSVYQIPFILEEKLSNELKYQKNVYKYIRIEITGCYPKGSGFKSRVRV